MNLSVMGSNNRPYTKFHVDDIDTIGVEAEAYSIVVLNDTSKRAKCKISIDGTDILTGQPATLDNGKGWLIESGRELRLSAWPETMSGGAAFVFTDPSMAVAAHTHGDTSALGYISVAYWVEGFQTRPAYHNVESYGAISRRFGGESFMRSSGTGAGSYTDQHLRQAAGLIQPVYCGIVQVRYMWWAELAPRLQRSSQHPSGFAQSQMANLGTTPRVVTNEPSALSRWS